MEIGQDEIQLYCSDVLNETLALIEVALCTSKVEIIAYNEEQFTNIKIAIDDIFNNFIYYYYAYGNNYTEHPCYKDEIDDCIEYEPQPYMPDYSHKNAKLQYSSLLETNEKVVNNNFMFEVVYNKKSDTAIKISFTITNKEKVKQALSEYLDRYRCDEVYNDYENTLDCATQRERLYQLLIADNYNLNNFHINDIRYIKALLDCEEKGKLFIQNIYIGFDENNEIICRCLISETGFIDSYRDSEIAIENKEVTTNNTDTLTLAGLKKLTEIEVHIISVKYHLEQVTGERATYKRIAEYMSKNDIYKITENNIKQKASLNIYNKLSVNDLTQAIYILKEHNMLKSYND